ncbi:hypothetical protein VNO80_25569 [Phaseolus coccineus]|uniref:Transmembrane protein n=1 Tax=Phaseolus coccineus TaxID=3886 RepID=A0AAN9LYV5_PHACN
MLLQNVSISTSMPPLPHATNTFSLQVTLGSLEESIHRRLTLIVVYVFLILFTTFFFIRFIFFGNSMKMEEVAERSRTTTMCAVEVGSRAVTVRACNEQLPCMCAAERHRAAVVRHGEGKKEGCMRWKT